MPLNILSFLCKLTVTLKCTHCKWNYFSHTSRAPFIMRKIGLAANAAGHNRIVAHINRTVWKNVALKLKECTNRNSRFTCMQYVRNSGNIADCSGPDARLLLRHQPASSRQLSILLAVVKTPTQLGQADSLRPAQCSIKSRQQNAVHTMRNQMSTNTTVPRLLPDLSSPQMYLKWEN